jgi:hypothetical protein
MGLDIGNQFKQAEGKLALVGDKTTHMLAKLEDICTRARKISNQLKEKGKTTDSMFGTDLGIFRRDCRSFGMEVITLSSTLSGILRDLTNESEPGHEKASQALMRVAGRISKGIAVLRDTAMMAHQLMKEPDHRIQAFYINQELTEMVDKTQGLPNIAQKIVLTAAEADAKAAAAKAGGTPPAAPPIPPAAS